MTTQSIDFKGMTSCTFNNQEVLEIRLDGERMWKKGLVYYDWFQHLKYNGGGCSINTGFTPQYGDSVYFKFDKRCESIFSLFGTRVGNGNAHLQVMLPSNTSSKKSRFNYSALNYTSSDGTDFASGGPFDVELSSTFFRLNGELKYYNSLQNTKCTFPGPIIINGLYNNGTIETTANDGPKMYYLKIIRSGNTVREWKPCTYNGEPGLYETVTQTFFGHTGNTGLFVVGND